MGVLRVKDGVEFGGVLHPAGARILEVLKDIVATYDHDLTITSARDGIHSGPADPHHSGEAFDIRTNDLTDAQKRRVVNDLRAGLYGSVRRFYVFLEASGLPQEHIHAQRRAGTQYSVLDYLASA